MSTPLLKSYIYQGGAKKFFVSTIHRESSAPIIPAQWFYETLAWELDADGERGEIVEDNSGATDITSAHTQHAETCLNLLRKAHP